MVWDGRPAHGAKVYSVVFAELVHAVVGHEPFPLEVVFAVPVEGGEAEAEAAVGGGEGVEELGGGVGDVDAYAVARDG